MIDLKIENRSKIQQQSIQKDIDNEMQVEMDFGSMFGGSWVGFGPDLGPKLGPRSSKKQCRKKHDNKMAKIVANFGIEFKKFDLKWSRGRVDRVQWGSEGVNPSGLWLTNLTRSAPLLKQGVADIQLPTANPPPGLGCRHVWMSGCLVGWLARWLVGWLVDVDLSGRLVVLLAGWLDGCLVGWLVCLLFS